MRQGRFLGRAGQAEAAQLPTPTQLAAQVALMEPAIVTLADTGPNRGALQRWLQVAGAEAEHDSPAGHAIRAAARLLAERLS